MSMLDLPCRDIIGRAIYAYVSTSPYVIESAFWYYMTASALISRDILYISVHVNWVRVEATPIFHFS